MLPQRLLLPMGNLDAKWISPRSYHHDISIQFTISHWLLQVLQLYQLAPQRSHAEKSDEM